MTMRPAESIDSRNIREEIDKILMSSSFAHKSQIRKLLELLGRNLDKQSALKPDCIIRELWPNETLTKTSADVAKEMNRLREALEAHYSTEGRSHSIRIVLPNRSKPGPDGLPERRWIAAQINDDSDGPVTKITRLDRKSLKYTGIAIAIFAACLLVYAGVHGISRAGRPYSGKIDDETLTIFDASGRELWTKSFPAGFWREYYEPGLANRMWFGDLEGNGHTEVLLLYHAAIQPQLHSTVLICYSDHGQERWRWTPGKQLPELQGTPSSFRTDGLGVLKAAPGTSARRIVMASGHMLYYPYQIAIVDANGKTVSEYWHSGQINHFTLADLNGDGREEIFAAGISNGYHQATLVVLDPDRVFGASAETARPDVQLHGMGAAHELLRVLFLRSDLNQAQAVYNEAMDVAVQNGHARLGVRECLQLDGCEIWYEFDKDLHLISATAADRFLDAHKEFYILSKSNHPFTPREEAEFLKVRCLSGCGSEFVPLAVR